tara:strand:- start:2360 stop:4063 length:1704 start_codon:yes stop_codon:yes gene_type:complete
MKSYTQSILQYKKLIKENSILFLSLIILLIFETFLLTTSLLTLIPIVDIFLDSNLENPNKVTIFLVQIFSAFNFEIELKNFLIFFIFIELIKSAINLYITKKIINLRIKVHEKLFINLFDNILKAKIRYFDTFKSEVLLNLLNNISKQVGANLSNIATQFSNLFRCIFYILIPLYLNYKLVLLTFLILFIIFFPLKNLKQKTYLFGKNILFYENQFIKKILEYLQSVKLIKAFQKEDYHKEITFEKLKKKNKFDSKKLFLENAIVSVYRPLSIIGVILSFVIYNQILKENIVISETVVIFWSLISVTPIINSILSNYLIIINSLPMLEKYNQSLNSAKKFSENIIKTSKEVLFKKSLKIRNLNFRYKNNFVLKNLNIDFLKNKTTVIVGPSGSGKSTLIDIILKFRTPDRGHIFLDNTDINQIKSNSYRSLFGYVPQDPFLFNETIKNNILWAKDKISKKDIDILLKETFCNEFIKNFREKEKKIAGERGLNISGGQRQRLALARALAIEPQILILDEPTSSLDKISKNYVLNSINNLRGKVTIIIITHDPDKSIKYDKIIKIKKFK